MPKATSATPLRPLPPLRVLIVDDTAPFRHLLACQLEHGGHQVVAGSPTLADALACIVEHAPDVVVINAHEPDGMGAETAHRILRVESGPTPGVVLCTRDAVTVWDGSDPAGEPSLALRKPITLTMFDCAIRLAALRAAGARVDVAPGWRRRADARLLPWRPRAAEEWSGGA